MSSSKPHRQHQGHFARKRFGQHFLTDESVIDAIVSAITPQPRDYLVEIGPGLGALTAPLLNQSKTLHAVELDRDLAVRLQQRFGERLILHSADALNFDFGALAKLACFQTNLPADTEVVALGEPKESKQENRDIGWGDAGTPTQQCVKSTLNYSAQYVGVRASPQPTTHSRPNAKLRIVGNLPYNISSPLLFHLIDYAPLVLDQHFMLQKEVVDRMVAAPGSKAYGRLSVMLQYHYLIDKLFDVPAEAFTPPPKVESAVVRMLPHPAEMLAPVNYTHLTEIVSAAFSQRRKMLRNTLAVYQTRIDFTALNFDLSRRAEEVSVDEYVRLAQQLT